MLLTGEGGGEDIARQCWTVDLLLNFQFAVWFVTQFVKNTPIVCKPLLGFSREAVN